MKAWWNFSVVILVKPGVVVTTQQPQFVSPGQVKGPAKGGVGAVLFDARDVFSG